MTTTNRVEPYLFFNGRCAEAIEFYRLALGAEVTMLMRFKDSPDPSMRPPSIDGDRVMHANIRIGGTSVMASDGDCADKAAFQGFALSYTVPTEAEANRYFNALAKDGKVCMPLTKTFFSPCFGMVMDKFGVMWMVIVQ